MTPRKPRPLHFYASKLWCEVGPNGNRRIMLRSLVPPTKHHETELSIPAHKRLWKWLKRATEWAEFDNEKAVGDVWKKETWS